MAGAPWRRRATISAAPLAAQFQRCVRGRRAGNRPPPPGPVSDTARRSVSHCRGMWRAMRAGRAAAGRGAHNSERHGRSPPSWAVHLCRLLSLSYEVGGDRRVAMTPQSACGAPHCGAAPRAPRGTARR